jgi:hypothetical protein
VNLVQGYYAIFSLQLHCNRPSYTYRYRPGPLTTSVYAPAHYVGHQFLNFRFLSFLLFSISLRAIPKVFLHPACLHAAIFKPDNKKPAKKPLLTTPCPSSLVLFFILGPTWVKIIKWNRCLLHACPLFRLFLNRLFSGLLSNPCNKQMSTTLTCVMCVQGSSGNHLKLFCGDLSDEIVFWALAAAHTTEEDDATF